MIKYRKGYKYQLAEVYRHLTPIKGYRITDDFIRLDPDGWLEIAEGYAWNGAGSSSADPAIDTDTNMRGSLVHDALYQLISRHLIEATHRAAADQLLYEICRQAGMCEVRARYYRLAVQKFGEPAATRDNPILTAP